MSEYLVMPLVPLDTQTALYLLGVVYLLMSGLVWMILRPHHEAAAISLWCGGGGVVGITYFIFTLGGLLPAYWTTQVPVSLGLLGMGLRLCALYRESGREGGWRVVMVAVAIAMLLVLTLGAAMPSWRRVLNGTLMIAAAVWIAVMAVRLGRFPHGRGSEHIAVSYAFFAGSYSLRIGVSVLAAASGTYVPPNLAPTLDLFLVLAGGLVAGIFGNVGYVGMALERARIRRDAQAADLAREQAQRSAAEARAAVLAERLAERDEFVRVLAHEVRQPLNNASAALQSAGAALQVGEMSDAGEVQARLHRAQKVISHIVGSIDNTLAATTVLASEQPLAPRDADVNVLLEMALGDLDPQQRVRVLRDASSSHARTAAMDIGLMRLALRNLLSNALAYSPRGSPVVLQVSDSDEPLGLVFEVRDQGPGIAPEMRDRLFQRGARGDHGLPSHGLGLYVVQQIMLRHGGRASWAPHEPQGSVFRLWLPLVD
ncbi:HAMP domain-containing sensor histidine kinase [Ideonella sp. DXS29W]|uniref:histidine kinase n=1 Tax=Ideonella lacteola TaxID=2984193 RepID=A0ABU9BTJ3_9BURK